MQEITNKAEFVSLLGQVFKPDNSLSQTNEDLIKVFGGLMEFASQGNIANVIAPAGYFFASPYDITGVATMRRIVSDDIPNINASKLDSGTINIARLGVNPSDNSKYLKGDNTWAFATANVEVVLPSSLFNETKGYAGNDYSYSAALKNQTGNTFFAGASDGSTGVPNFRTITLNDLPTITVAKGGTGLTGIGTSNQVLRVNALGTALEYATLTISATYAGLTDVNLTSVSNGQLTKYDTASGKWVNFTPTYLTSYTETDPIFVAHAAYNVTAPKITNWDTAFSWGNHASAGYVTASSVTAFTNKSGNISQWTNDSNYITVSGVTDSLVTGKVLTGLNITGGSISSTDTILAAFGKLQNQLNGIVGGATYQGTWNATTNSPSLSSGVGTKGYYYVVSVNGSTNLDGITDWKVGDWAIFNGTTWNKVDNTDAVSSVNGSIGAITLSGTASRISVTGNVWDIDAAYVGQTSITTLGTITTGVWNGTAIGVAKGGTGLTTVAAGSIIGYNTLDTATAITSTTGLKVLQISTTTISWATVTGTGTPVYSTTPTFVTSVVGSATMAVFNTVSTVINAFGAATTVTIGAATGTTTIANATVTLSNATAFNINGANPTIASTATGTLTLFNTALLTVAAFGAATTITIGGTPTGAITHNYSTNATLTATTKTINFATGGASGSTTTITIGSITSGAINNLKLSITPASDATGDMWYRASTGYLARIAAGSQGYTLTMGASSVPGWTDTTLIPANRQTASYTLALTDKNGLVEMNVATANTLTIPPNASVAFPIGTQILGAQYGAGTITITPGAGVALRSRGGFLKSAGQYAGFTMVKIATDEWYVWGDLIL